MIDINSGTFDQLKSLVGIGDTYAKRIVEGRPYQRPDELVTKKIIPQTTYDKIKDHILIKREFPVCEDGGESKVLRSRTSPARNQLRTTPVKAWESIEAEITRPTTNQEATNLT